MLRVPFSPLLSWPIQCRFLFERWKKISPGKQTNFSLPLSRGNGSAFPFSFFPPSSPSLPSSHVTSEKHSCNHVFLVACEGGRSRCFLLRGARVFNSRGKTIFRKYETRTFSSVWASQKRNPSSGKISHTKWRVLHLAAIYFSIFGANLSEAAGGRVRRRQPSIGREDNKTRNRRK